MTLAYAELDARSNFSFLEGGSHPAELVMQAKALGHAAFGIADRNTLAGVVRAHAEAKTRGMKLLVGCRLAFRDGSELIVYPRDRTAYGRLCRLLSIGKSAVAEPEGDAPSRPPPCEWGRGTTRSVLEGAGLGSELADAPSTASRSPSPVNGGGQVGMAAAEPRIPKGECWLDFEQAVALGEGMIALVPAPAAIDAAFEARLAAWRRAWPEIGRAHV